MATNDSRLRLWSLIDPSNSPSRVMSGHKSQVGQLRASLGPRLGPAQQDLVVSGSEDGKVYVWGLGVDRRGYQESFKGRFAFLNPSPISSKTKTNSLFFKKKLLTQHVNVLLCFFFFVFSQ